MIFRFVRYFSTKFCVIFEESPSSTILPLSNIEKLFAAFLIKFTFCSTIIIVKLNSLFNLIKTFSISSTTFGCIPSVGSSNINIFGLVSKALAIASCCCCPPDKSPPLLFQNFFNIGNSS